MKINLYVLFLFCCSSLSAQNLVPNPSFENYINCPVNISEVPFPSGTPVSVEDWTKPTESSSDYYNSCGLPYLVDIPENFCGYQYARTGNAYVGVYGIQGLYREYIQAKLSTPLIAGHSYFVSYWISLGEVSNYLGVSVPINAVDQMGAYLSNIEEERPLFGTAMSDLQPQVKSPVGIILSDTAGWMNIAGTFTAAGNEAYIIIGNFTHDDSFNLVHVVGNDIYARNYYYIDDVCVLDLDGEPLTTRVLDTLFCNENLTLSATMAGRTYLWNDGSTVMDKEITGPGTYWVKSMSLNDCNFHIDTFNVRQNTIVPIELGNDTILCDAVPLTLNAYDASYISYLWNTGATTSTITVSEIGTYFVQVASECAKGGDTIVIAMVALPEAKLPPDTLLCTGDILTLRNQTTDFINTWSNGETGCCIDITEAGTYTLTVTNICGEQATDDFAISFTGCKDCLFVPTVFSPNSDGLNDEFEVQSNCNLDIFGIKIFNRWGQLVFSSLALDKKWDGLVNGAPAEVGVYFYQLKATPSMPNIGKIEMKGDITLVR